MSDTAPATNGRNTTGLDLNLMRDFADDFIRPRLERVPGVSQASVGGGAPRQIRIEADAHRLSLCNVSDAPPAALLAEGAAGRQPGLKGPASSGQGLGLSIVRRLAERHGLSLTLSHDHGHTCATLSELVGFTSASRPAA